jgi:excinuclease ABC subunit C
LSERSGHRISVLVPQRGEKKDLVDHALVNAREALGRELAESASQKTLLAGVAERFGLPEPPQRIEVYDNSHIMGTNPVGAMIVAGPGGFVKAQYRKFNMRSEDLKPGDDYAMMREMLGRRFSRLLKEAGPREGAAEGEETTTTPWPDLVFIDGGKGQLAAAVEVVSELGIADLPLVGVAKGPDRDAGREVFHRPGHDPFMLQPRDPVLYFVQRLRDEAHRFAIGSHRTRRRIDMARNPLDEISGIGPTRKRALLHHFGTAKAVSRASVEDLVAVEGISRQTAQLIYDHFHEGAA